MTLRNFALFLALSVMPAYLVPVAAHAQQNQQNAEQRAYQAGYQNGVNDRRENKALNLRTDNWHGGNLQSYEQGYQDGYRGNGARNAYGPEGQTDAEQRAYRAGYQNGVNDRRENKALNLRTDNWHGSNLQSYQRGYETGYRQAGGKDQHHDDDNH